jgi:hypothetical protein
VCRSVAALAALVLVVACSAPPPPSPPVVPAPAPVRQVPPVATDVPGATIIPEPSPAPSHGGRFTKWDGARKEFEVEVARLAFPQGTGAGPFVRQTGGDYAGDDWYEVGYGASMADWQYVCAWYGVWLDARTSDPEAAAIALEAVTSITSLPVWESMDKTSHAALAAAFDTMRAGGVPANGESLLGCEPAGR